MATSLKSSSKDIFNITREGFKMIQDSGLTLDQVFFLEKLSNGQDISQDLQPEKLELWKQTLIRKGYLSDIGILTKSGFELIKSVQSGTSFPSVVHSQSKLSFEDWWKAYPSTDIFTFKGKSFTGDRSLKPNKKDCQIKFAKIIAEDDYTIEDMIRALEYEIIMKKESSLKEGTNKLKYMQNSLTYLNQRTFENFMEVSKTAKIKPTSGGVVDI